MKNCHFITIAALFGALSGGLSPSVLAGESVEREMAVAADAVIRIVNTRGDVTILGWDENRITIDGELDDLAEELIFEAQENRILIEVKMPRKDVNWGDGSDLRIRVPSAGRVSFEGVSTDLNVSDVRGGAQLRSVSGDVKVGGMDGRLVVNVVSGDVEIDGAGGRTSVSSISGDMDIEMSGTELDVESVSGDVDIELADFSRLRGRSVSGEIKVEGRLLASGEVDLNSVSGDIALQLNDPINANVRAKSGVGGDIRNGMSDQSPRDVFPSQQELSVNLGDGSGSVRIGTVSADIRLN